MDNFDVIQKIVAGSIDKYELAENDLTFSKNKDSSVSLMLRSKLVMRLYLQGNEQFFLTNISYAAIVNDLGFKSEKAGATPNFMKICICDLSLDDKTVILIEKIIDRAIQAYSEGDFGCCHRYVECSDNLKCMHPDKLYSNSCQYKRNLKSGKIFYGNNANSSHITSHQ